MPRVNILALEKRMVLAVVKYSRATKEGAMVTYHTPGGLRTVGSDGLRHELQEADMIDRLEVASRLDTESLASGDQAYPEGTDDEVFNLLVGLKPPGLPGHPVHGHPTVRRVPAKISAIFSNTEAIDCSSLLRIHNLNICRPETSAEKSPHEYTL